MDTNLKTKKDATHDRIIEASARAIRKHGYDGVSVAEVMKSAGLTHGGFYAHFESRETMLSEAVDRAGADTVALLTRVVGGADGEPPLHALIRSYLSHKHVERVETGCPIAALGSDTPRQAPEVRKSANRRIKEMIDLVARESPDWGQPGNHEQALVTVSTMVGALILARSVDDPTLVDTVRDELLKQLSN
ncbi:MAG: hypothetical protein RL761_961 [Pseudomonadota bacterium]|jgi:TetR/AcrR family transcriptional regulator, transcriptional repressor for nem operon